MVNIVEGECLLKRKQVLGAVGTGERLLDCVSAGVATVIAQAGQHLGGRTQQGGIAERKAMIDREHGLPMRRPIGRTSRPEPLANGPHLNRSGHSEKQRRPICRSPREQRPKEQTTDATGTAVLESQFRGCSQALLYNGRRPHSSLDGSTPDKAYFNPLPIRMAA